MKKLFVGTLTLMLALMPKAVLAKTPEFASTQACRAGTAECVNSVITEMERRLQPLIAACDHDALFLLNYLTVTQVYRQVGSQVGFNNIASVNSEVGLFGDYYFQAFDAYHSGEGYVAPAWQLQFDAAQNRAVSGAGNLAMGINAHVQRDMPFMLYDLYLQGTPVSYEDHTLFNQVLLVAGQPVLDAIATQLDPTINADDVPGIEDDIQRFQVVAGWRETAFRNYERLRDAPNDAARTQVAAEIEAYSAAFAQGILQTYLYPPGTDSSARDAFCQACQAKAVPESNTVPALLLLGSIGLGVSQVKSKKFVSRHS